jgi:oligopeptide transport system ATP-binding protein
MSKSIDYSNKVLEVSHLKEYFKVGVGKNKLKIKAVDDVSFDIYKKEVFGLVGESGCGKTTTGRTIIRLYKPTNGTVKLYGNVIGSGSDDTLQLLKTAKKEYLLKLLSLNQYRYDKHLIEQEFSNKEAIFQEQINDLKLKSKKLISKIESETSNYKNALFEEKNKYQVDVEKVLFAYNVNKDDITKKTKNEYLVEYNNLVKGLEFSFKRKIQGINESAGLSDEAKANHKKKLLESHNIKLEAYKVEFMPKIEEKSHNLLSKEDCKARIAVLKSEFLADKAKLLQAHKQFILDLKKPDYLTIKQNLANEKSKLNEEIAKIVIEIKKLSKQKAEKLASVNSSKIIDREQLKQITLDYKEYKKQQKAIIRESNYQQNSMDAIQNVKQMQMIFQDPISSLNPRMTVQEIVSEGLVINGERNSELIIQKVKDALELVGLAPEYISRYPHEFSGGQRQRIGIARALIMNPSIIVADEPISALDVSIKAQVINLLSELREKLDLTILFIAHDLSVVKFFCDRIAVMYYGKLVELASSEELFAHPLHNYTKSLLSAIPHPDPDFEKTRKRIFYSPSKHNYTTDLPEFVEVTKDHFVYANKQELIEMKKELGVTDEN